LGGWVRISSLEVVIYNVGGNQNQNQACALITASISVLLLTKNEIVAVNPQVKPMVWEILTMVCEILAMVWEILTMVWEILTHQFRYTEVKLK
jgi:phosphopantothenate synthetase